MRDAVTVWEVAVMEKRDTGGNVWRPAPCQGALMRTGSIEGVWTGPSEEVDWIWTHGPGGSYVSGYVVRKPAAIETWTFNDAGKQGDEE